MTRRTEHLWQLITFTLIGLAAGQMFIPALGAAIGSALQ